MKIPKYSTVIFFGLLIFGLLVVNDWVSQQAEESTVLKVEQTVVRTPKNTKYRKRSYKGPVTRKTMLDPGRKYSFSLIYAEGKEVARFKSANKKIYDLEGDIPNGRVKFTDETNQTYGTEHYYDNQLHGEFREYYSNGNIKREGKYAKGRIKINREYYIDGVMRMEENYQDTILFAKSKEVGVGKVYYRDGKLMYEWNITNQGQGGYNRSYDRNGKMVAENLFDANGELTTKKVIPEYQKR